MEAIHDELCVDDHDEYVKCTTVYPTFINTSQNLANFLGKKQLEKLKTN